MGNIKEELRAAFAEFIATMLFVFFGVGAVNAMIRAQGYNNQYGHQPINYSVAFGFAITVLAYSIGDVSGGHINPAVTFTLALTGNITATRAIFYIIAQLIGGIIGGGLLCAACGGMEDKAILAYVSGIGINGGLSGDGYEHLRINHGQAFLFEFMGTLILLFTVYNVAVWTSAPLETHLQMNLKGTLAPIPIGMAVLVAHLTLGPYTGCGINPARVLGAVIWEENFFDDKNGSTQGEMFWVYWIGPMMAAVVAPVLYYALYSTIKPGSSVEKMKVQAARS